jgi:hypothetical protein
VKFDQSVYPRKTHDPALVQKYVECLDEIEAKHNFMSVSEDMTLLDGRHRHLAYLKRYEGNGHAAEVDVFVYPVVEDEDKLSTSIELNNDHGWQLSDKDKARCAEDLYIRFHWPLDKIAVKVSAAKRRVLEWTKDLREQEEKRQNEAIFDLYLSCHTEDEIAEATGISRQTVNRKLEVLPKEFPGTKWAKLSLFDDFTDEQGHYHGPLYDVWSFNAKTNDVSHFGNSEQRILDRLLYLYTEPFDIVVDTFAGGGSTIDVCKYRLRRYWASDRKPILERANEIRTLDAVSLPPLANRWSQVSLTYLDPPYWKQAEGQYSKDPEDLANMPLDKFTDTLAGIIKGISKKQSKGVIAMLIQPTQWRADDRIPVDHVLDIINAVGNKTVRLIHRVSCPYQTEQYNAQQIEWAKANKQLLVLTRELVVWRVNG